MRAHGSLGDDSITSIDFMVLEPVLCLRYTCEVACIFGAVIVTIIIRIRIRIIIIIIATVVIVIIVVITTIIIIIYIGNAAVHELLDLIVVDLPKEAVCTCRLGIGAVRAVPA